jgi:hypothetical protein
MYFLKGHPHTRRALSMTVITQFSRNWTACDSQTACTPIGRTHKNNAALFNTSFPGTDIKRHVSCFTCAAL